MNATTVARLELLHPRLKLKGQQLCQILSLKGIDVEISQGLRTWAEQDALYAQGRTTVGQIVTEAKGGESWHNLGCAFDIYIKTASGIDWTGKDSAWQAAIATGRSLELTCGADWQHEPDRPHFQITGPFLMDKPDDEALYLFREGGLNAVWAEIDKYYSGVQEKLVAEKGPMATPDAT